MSGSYQKVVFANATGEKFQIFFRVDGPTTLPAAQRKDWLTERLVSAELAARKRGLTLVEVEPRVYTEEVEL